MSDLFAQANALLSGDTVLDIGVGIRPNLLRRWKTTIAVEPHAPYLARLIAEWDQGASALVPLRMDWEATQSVIPESHEWPAPEVPAIVVHRADYAANGPVTGLVKLAESKGWTVKVIRARGCLPSVGGRPSRQRWSFAVRLRRGNRRAVAVHTEGPSEGSAWSWDSMYAWSSEHPIHGYETITAFKADLE